MDIDLTGDGDPADHPPPTTPTPTGGDAAPDAAPTAAASSAGGGNGGSHGSFAGGATGPGPTASRRTRARRAPGPPPALDDTLDLRDRRDGGGASGRSGDPADAGARSTVGGDPAAPGGRPARGDRHDWPIVGRSDELHLIRQLLTTDPPAPVVIEATLGTGKTRLLREVVADLRSEGFAIEWVVANAATSAIPFGAMAPLLPPPRTGSVIGAYEVDTMPAVRQAVVARASGRGLVLAVDDAHSLDEASATVIHQLAVKGDVRVVVAVERGRAAPDPIDALRSDPVATCVELGDLETVEVARLLELGLGAPVDAHASAALSAASAGNALHLRELVRAAERAGRLSFDADRWVLHDPLPDAGTLADLVDSRLRELDESAREVVELLAVGEPLNLQVLDALGSHAGLVDAERDDLIRTDLDGRRFAIRLSHPLYGERIRRRLPAVRTRQLFRRLSEGVAATGLRRADDVLRSMTWRLDAGLPAPADLLLVAARQATDGFDLRRAERFAKAAVDAGGGDAALVALADARLRQGRFLQALAALDAIDAGAGRIAEPASDADPRTPPRHDPRSGTTAEPLSDEEAEAALAEAVTGARAAVTADAAELRAVVTFIGLGRRREALERLATTEASLPHADERARLRTCRARLLLADGRVSEAVGLVTELDVSEIGPEAAIGVLGTLGPALGLVGRFDDAEATVRNVHGAVLSIGEDEPAGLSWAPLTMLVVHNGRGENRAHDELATALIERGAALRHDGIRAAGIAALGWSHCLRGDLTRAIGLLRDATAFPPRLDADATFVQACGGLALAHALAGHPDRAQDALELAASTTRPPVRWFDHRLAIGRALTSAAAGASDDARDLLADQLAIASMPGQRWAQLELCAAALRVGAADLVAPMLAQLRTTIDGPLVGVYADQAAAWLAGDGHGLDTASVELERLGLLLPAAEASVCAATAHDELGFHREAVNARVRASRLLGRCPGAARPDPRLAPRPR